MRRGRRRGKKTVHSELSLIPRDREGERGERWRERRKRDGRGGRLQMLVNDSAPSRKHLDRPVGLLQERASQ
jgi:hypothetical protein